MKLSKFLSQFTLFIFTGALLASAAAQEGGITLDFEYFQNEVQPIFLVKRDGNVTCAKCHAGSASSQFRLQPLSEGAFFWNEEQSRQNFEAVKNFVAPGYKPIDSRFLRHPLAAIAGGDPFHGGGKHWASQEDPEWQILAAWVGGATERAPVKERAARIIQTNAAGDNSHVIDPSTNRVVGIIDDILIPHGVTTSPDGRHIYISDEALHTLDVVDARTLKIARRIPLSGRPNNISVTPNGNFVYVGIMEMPGTVDIIDVRAMVNAKTLKVNGAIHNVYVTPDGKHAVAGSIHTRTINVIDTATQELAWELTLDAGIRPMAFDTNPDGSTKNIYVQLSNFHGFAVIDFAARKEVARIEHPAVEGVHAHYDGLQSAPTHGLQVSPDGKTLWSTSKVYGCAYIHSLPDLKEIARVFVGQHPEWLAFTPDGKFAYVAAAGDNQTFVIDTTTYKEVARIDVGQVPKRNGMGILAIK